jgi:thiosulfate/3-mercaptopyruvate sulfurtransferase
MIPRPTTVCESLWKEEKQMKKKSLFGLIVLALVAVPLCITCTTTAPRAPTAFIAPPTRTMIDPIVSTQWLGDNMSFPNLLILDIRAPENYAKGHIPGAINVPGLGNFYLCLFAPDCGLWMELPEEKALLATLGNAGITGNSLVVVVGRTTDPFASYAVADAARVAATILYAGVENVAILNGGYDKWAAEGRTTSTVAVKPTAVTYTGAVNKEMFVSKDYVEGKIGKCITVDGRDPDFYYGVGMEPFYTRPGHIPSAKNLPAPWFWAFAKDKKGVITYGTWKDAHVIREMASAVIGEDASEEIIAYCGVGGYASSLWFVLREVVGYTDVKIYDGSMQEWTADPQAPLVKYICE